MNGLEIFGIIIGCIGCSFSILGLVFAIIYLIKVCKLERIQEKSKNILISSLAIYINKDGEHEMTCGKEALIKIKKESGIQDDLEAINWWYLTEHLDKDE